MKRPVFLLAGFAVLGLTLEISAQTLRGPLRPEGVALAAEQLPPPAKVVVGRSGLPPFRIAAPANLAARPKGATLTIDYLAAGEANIYGDVCVGWPAAAQAAFSYAANIWSTYINSDVPIVISASWANLGTDGVLGHAGARDFSRNFSGAPQADTMFPIAIANALSGSDLNGSATEEIVAGFNAQFSDWYYGTDGNCPADKIDLVEVVLHELCHGLGFLGSMTVSGGLGSWGAAGFPLIYDRYAENGSGQQLLDTTLFPNGSVALYNQLVSGSVYFDGANAVSGNGGAKVALYAPATWSQGSSYSHLDEVFNGTAHALMTYSADFGEAIHDPGAVILGLMKDVGWNTSSSTSSPVASGTPLMTDYDGDFYADLGIVRSDGSWHVLLSRQSYGYFEFNSGASGSQYLPQQGDFDGDLYSDPAVFDSSSGYWYFMSSKAGYSWYYILRTWPVSGGTPVSGDFDGDRKADPVAYSSGNSVATAGGTWLILLSSYAWDGHYSQIDNWGSSGQTPVCADYDGDGYADAMLYEESTGYWKILTSRSDYESYSQIWFGATGYSPVSNDFDGDRYADLAVYNESTGTWYALLSTTGYDINRALSGVWDGSAR